MAGNWENRASLESEVTYSDVKLDLPGSLSSEQYARYRDTGKALETQDPWKNSARNSSILFINSRLGHRAGAWLFKPRIYYNQWQQFHPVTGSINDMNGWERNFGIDLEGNHMHSLFGMTGSMVVEGTWRCNWNDSNALQFAYADVVTAIGGRIVSTLSDRKGLLMSRSNVTNDLWGIYFLESLSPIDHLTVDLQMCFDQVDIERNEFQKFDFTAGRYAPGIGLTRVKQNYDLFAPKAAVTYRATDQINVYATVAHANQVPDSRGAGVTGRSILPAITRTSATRLFRLCRISRRCMSTQARTTKMVLNSLATILLIPAGRWESAIPTLI